MVLTNVFTATPQCAPSRAAFYTGLYPFKNGAHPNWSEVKPGTKSLPHYMQALGYRVVLMGKRHMKPAENFPFEWYADGIGSKEPGPELKRLLDDLGSKPLFLIYAKFGTHFPWSHNKFQYDPEKVGFQPYVIDTPEAREMRANYYSAITEMDEAVGEFWIFWKRRDNRVRALLCGRPTMGQAGLMSEICSTTLESTALLSLDGRDKSSLARSTTL